MVLAKADDKCPSCGGSTAGAPEVPVTPVAAEETATLQHFEEERKDRHEVANQVHARGQQLQIAGICVGLIALVISVASFLDSARGGSYFLWTGGVVAGASMVWRGHGLMLEARRVRDP